MRASSLRVLWWALGAEPLGGGDSEALGEDAGERGGVGVADGGGDAFERVAFAQHGLSDAGRQLVR